MLRIARTKKQEHTTTTFFTLASDSSCSGYDSSGLFATGSRAFTVPYVKGAKLLQLLPASMTACIAMNARTKGA
jgi:hypothetical protein